MLLLLTLVTTLLAGQWGSLLGDRMGTLAEKNFPLHLRIIEGQCKTHVDINHGWSSCYSCRNNSMSVAFSRKPLHRACAVALQNTSTSSQDFGSLPKPWALSAGPDCGPNPGTWWHTVKFHIKATRFKIKGCAWDYWNLFPDYIHYYTRQE
ncbi:hypothetical protein BJX61DRAFT_126393 [Aspergillus egyptiacus]|nr:hypothetical protein BJX61DRAFT_126393 [Aspergillus egyptiacus]